MTDFQTGNPGNDPAPAAGKVRRISTAALLQATLSRVQGYGYGFPVVGGAASADLCLSRWASGKIRNAWSV